MHFSGTETKLLNVRFPNKLKSDVDCSLEMDSKFIMCKNVSRLTT